MSDLRVLVRSSDPKLVRRLPKLDMKRWKRVRAEFDNIHVMDEVSMEASRKAHQEAVIENTKYLRTLYKERPDLLLRLEERQRQQEAPAPTITFIGSDGKPNTVKAIAGEAMVRDAIVARALLRSRDNQARVYETLHRYLSEAAAGDESLTNKLSALPERHDIKTVTVDRINDGIEQLTILAGGVLDGMLRPPSDPPPGRPATCNLEEGTGLGGDSVGIDPNKAKAANGLLLNANWPLKFFTTCVRNQGQRGTCSAFAVTAAVEAAIAFGFGRWTNLAEQDLYKHQRHDWWPFDDHDDGYTPALSLLLQMTLGYRYPFERDWDYNPSFVRVDQNHVYSHSCDNYANPNCSDTNHQSHQTCWQVSREVQTTITETVSRWVETAVQVIEDVVNWLGSLVGNRTHIEIGGHWVEETATRIVTSLVSTRVCAFDTSIPGTSGFGVNAATLLWDPLTQWQFGMAGAKAHLNLAKPVVWCFYVMPSFSEATAMGGYVPFRGTGEQVDPNSGHCTLITGYVDNANLPAGAPPGAGGGYFIVKNSWGTDFGDCGYAYVPYDWVAAWTTCMVAVDVVS